MLGTLLPHLHWPIPVHVRVSGSLSTGHRCSHPAHNSIHYPEGMFSFRAAQLVGLIFLDMSPVKFNDDI
jgi:hypothetical protein